MKYNTGRIELTGIIKSAVMFRQCIISTGLFLFTGMLCAQEKMLPDRWSANTAYLMSKNSWEIGIFQPFRYGVNGKVEIMANAVTIFLLPNAGLRISLGTAKGFVFASEHSISYPSLFLNIVSFKGTGGLISPQYDFPFMLSVSNSLLITKPLSASTFITASAGFSFAIRDYKPDYQATIDLPVFYPRMAHYYEGISLRTGFSIKGTLAKRFLYEENIRMFLITRESENLFLENSGNITWAVGKSVHLKGGYILSWGRYPYGNYLQLWPVIDIVFGSWERKPV
jgi:hypothetical protein